MDSSKFTEGSPGRLIQTNEDYAFIPDPLPPEWVFPVELWPLLSEVKQQLGVLEGLGRTLPNPALLIRPMADRESILSSRLEGTYASPKELLLFAENPQEPKSASDPRSEWQEVHNYQRALEEGAKSKYPITLWLIRSLHEILLSGVRGKEKSPGKVRECGVIIGTQSRFVPPPLEHLKECLDAFDEYLNAPSPQFDPLVHCFLVHYQLEAIHPFEDGNGRIGRLLLAMMIKRSCVLTKTWLYMSEYFERNREEYVQRLFDVSAKADWAGWIEFCLIGAREQIESTISRCDKLRQLQKDCFARLAKADAPGRLNSIVESLFDSCLLSITDLRDRLGVTYPTAKSDVERLVDLGILKELANIKPKTYYAPEIFLAAYDGVE